MLSRKEYKVLCELEKNNLSEKYLNYAVQPDFVYNHKWIDQRTASLLKTISNIKPKKNVFGDDDFSEKELNELSTIGQLLDRDLILKMKQDDFVYDDTTKSKTKMLTCIFKITNYGYNSMLEHRQWYKFWIPTSLALASFVISISPYLFPHIINGLKKLLSIFS